jgi:hypothetical protein
MRDMNVMSGSDQAVGISDDDKGIAEQLLQMREDGDLKMKAWGCSGQGGSVKDDISYIAENGNAHYYQDGNCSLPDTQVMLAGGLMKFILAAAEKLKENDMVLSINSLVASHGASDGGNHPEGKAVDFGCPSGKEAECQQLLDTVGAEFGFSAQVSDENYLLDPDSTHAHFSTTGT